jgi:hypothetical protein
MGLLRYASTGALAERRLVAVVPRSRSVAKGRPPSERPNQVAAAIGLGRSGSLTAREATCHFGRLPRKRAKSLAGSRAAFCVGTDTALGKAGFSPGLQ